MTKLTIVRETDQEIVFLDYFEDMPVHFTRNKMTGQITVNADDMVRGRRSIRIRLSLEGL